MTQSQNKKNICPILIQKGGSDMAKRKAKVQKTECVSCGTCVKVCPVGAISIKKGLFADVAQNCVGCGKCAKACPASVISIEEVLV